MTKLKGPKGRRSLSGMYVNNLGVAKRTDLYKQQHFNFYKRDLNT